jgi:hypothetical protein
MSEYGNGATYRTHAPDLTNDGKIDFNDFRYLAQLYWLARK